MIVAFTGPTILTREQELLVVNQLEANASLSLDIWRSGCAHGVDTIVARQGILSGVLGVELFVPAAPHNADLVDELRGRARINTMPSGSNEPYRKRNRAMVLGANMLVAFVKSPTFYRSGEWMTVNIARQFGVEVDLILI